MLHSVGCPQPKASVFINSWNSPSYDNACVHGLLTAMTTRCTRLSRGTTGAGTAAPAARAAATTPTSAWRCASQPVSSTQAGEFTCSDTATAKAVAKRTYEAAVELFAMLCRQYSLNPTADGVIISHREGHSRGIASNHGDPEHLWTQLGMGYTMDTFRQAVKAAMDGGSSAETTDTWYRVRKTWADAKSQKGAFKVLENAKNCADENPGYSVFDVNGVNIYTPNTAAFSPYLVRVSITDLNIRKGPGTNYAKTGKYTGIGTFTIVEEADGQGASRWGRLKSGAGWISLDYCTKV